MEHEILAPRGLLCTAGREQLTEPLHELERDERAAEPQEGAVDVGATLVADSEAAESVTSVKVVYVVPPWSN